MGQEEQKQPSEQKTGINFVFKMPFDVEKRIHAFALIHLLHKSFPRAEFHFITPKHHQEVLYLLPFHGYYHEWDDLEVTNPFEVHRYCANMKITKTDVFFCLTENTLDASIGKFLRAKQSIGYAQGMLQTMLYTKPIKKPLNHHLAENYLELYKEYTNNFVSTELKISGKKLEPFYKERFPYIAVDLYPFEEKGIESFWIEYFDFFQGKDFVLYSHEEKDRSEWILKNIIPKLSDKNRYHLAKPKNFIEIGKILGDAQLLVSRYNASSLIAAYLGTDSLIIFEDVDPKLTAPFYFYANWILLETSDPTIGEETTSKGSELKGKSKVSPDVLFEKTLEILKE